jgi:hypothetical protein
VSDLAKQVAPKPLDTLIVHRSTDNGFVASSQESHHHYVLAACIYAIELAFAFELELELEIEPQSRTSVS